MPPYSTLIQARVAAPREGATVKRQATRGCTDDRHEASALAAAGKSAVVHAVELSAPSAAVGDRSSLAARQSRVAARRSTLDAAAAAATVAAATAASAAAAAAAPRCPAATSGSQAALAHLVRVRVRIRGRGRGRFRQGQGLG